MFTSPFDQAWLSRMDQIFIALTNSKKNNDKWFKRNGPVRLVDLWSRVSIDPAVVTADGQQIQLFDPPAGLFDLVKQPKFQSQQPTSQGTMLGFLSWGFDIDTQGIALEVEVNPIMQAMSSAFVELEYQNAIVGGPVRVGECLSGSQAQRISEATVAGEIAGNPRQDRPLHVMSNPVFIQNNTTAEVVMTVEGTKVAAAASAAFEFRMNIKALVAQGAFSNESPPKKGQ